MIGVGVGGWHDGSGARDGRERSYWISRINYAMRECEGDVRSMIDLIESELMGGIFAAYDVA